MQASSEKSLPPPPEKKLIEYVKAKYRQDNRITNDFSIALPIEESYTQLAIVEEKEQREKENAELSSVKTSEGEVQERLLPSFEQIYGTKKPIKINDIFKESKVKRVLILGRAGIGKSTLCHRLAYQWANPEVNLWTDKFELVIWVPLRNLVNYADKESTPFHVVLKECIGKDRFGREKCKVDFVEEHLEKLLDKTLWILDGFDEISKVIEKENLQQELICLLLNMPNVIITSRPYAIEAYLGSQRSKNAIDLRLENTGFSDASIDFFIEKFFEVEQEPVALAGTLKTFLRTNSSINGIAHIPINLLLICHYWNEFHGKSNNSGDFPTILTMTELYSGIVRSMCKKYLKVMHKREVGLAEAFRESECQPLLAFLARLAYKQMKTSELIISSKAIQKLINKDAIKISFKSVLDLGLLKFTGGKNEPDDSSKDHYFVHLTFQEFFAAWHITEKLKLKDKNIILFIRKNKYNPIYEIVWWFVAGLLKEEAKILEIFFDILEAEPRDLAQIYHQMLLMRCMDECQLKVNSERKKGYLSNLCQFIDVDLSKKKYFYHGLRTYLNLSKIVFNQPEVVDKYCGFLNGNDSAKKRGALSILNNQSNVPKKIVNCVFDLLRDLSSDVRSEAINFFKSRKEVPEEIQRSVVGLLRDPHWNVRSKAVIFFESRQEVSEEIQRSVVDLIKDPDGNVRSAALGFFGTRKEVSEEIQRNVMDLLKDPDWAVRSAALRFFGTRKEVSDEIQRNVMDLLKDPDWEVRSAALGFFGTRKEVSEEIQRNVMDLLKDPDWAVRSAAFRFFETRKEVSEEIQGSMADLLRDEDETVRSAAVSLFEDREVAEEIQRNVAGLLSDEDETVRSAAVSFFEDREVAEEIQRNVAGLLSDEDETVRSAAVSFFEDREVSEEIQRSVGGMLIDPDEDVRSAAVNFFVSQKEVSEEIQRSVTDLLKDPDWEVRSAALRFFESRKEVSEEIQRSVTGLLKDPEWVVRSAAVSFFESRKEVSEEIQRNVMGLLKDPDWDVRFASVSFFKDRERFEEIQRSVMGLLKDPNWIVRSKAVSFFEGREVSEKIQRRVGVLLNDEDERVRSAALKFFESRKEVLEDTQRSVAGLLKDRDWEVRSAALRFFEDREVSEEIRRNVGGMLTDSDKDVRSASVSFFESQKEVPEEIQRSVTDLLKDLDEEVRSAALKFFESRKEVSEKIQRSAADLLRDEDECVRAAALNFFESLKEVSEEIQRSVVDLLRDEDVWVRAAALNFFESRKEVSEEIQRSVANLLKDSNLRKDSKQIAGNAVVSFFEDRQEIFPSFFEIAGNFLRNGEEEDGDAGRIFLSTVSVNQIIRSFKKRNKGNINLDFVTVIVIKLLLSNISLYQIDKTHIRVGSKEEIAFENEEELIEFIEKFQQIFQEFTGLNFEKTRIYSDEILDEIQSGGNDMEEHSSEGSKDVKKKGSQRGEMVPVETALVVQGKDDGGYKENAESFLQVLAGYSDLLIQLEKNPSIFALAGRNSFFAKGLEICLSSNGNEEQIKQELEKLSKGNKGLFGMAVKEPGVSQYGIYATHYFAIKGCYKVHQFLVSRGFSPEATTTAGFHANQLAVIFRRHDFLKKALSQENAQLKSSLVTLGNVKVLLNELHMAVITNDFMAVQVIFEKIKDIDSGVSYMGNILNLAVVFADKQMVQFLLQQSFAGKATVRDLLRVKESNHNIEALALAANLGKDDIVIYLLDYIMSDVNIADRTGMVRRAFYQAARAGEADIVRLFLVKYGFQPDSDSEFTETVISIRDTYPNVYNIIVHRKLPIRQKPDPKFQKYFNLSLQGGGMKGAIYPYALEALESCCAARQEQCKDLGKQEDEIKLLGVENIRRVIGTSAGSLLAVGYSLGASSATLKTEMDYDFSTFLDTEELTRLSEMMTQTGEDTPYLEIARKIMDVENGEMKEAFGHADRMANIYEQMAEIGPWNIVQNFRDAKQLYGEAKAFINALPGAWERVKHLYQEFKGFSNGDAIYSWLTRFMNRQGVKDPSIYTFGDHAKKVEGNHANGTNYKHLYIVVTCLDTRAPVTLSSENEADHDYVILDAARASMSIPFAFKPWQLVRCVNGVKSRSEYWYADGGMFRNCPVTEFDCKRFTKADATGDPNYPDINMGTFGFTFVMHKTLPLKPGYTLKDFVLFLAGMYLEAENIIATYEDKEYGRTVALDTGNISTLSFKKLNDEEKAFLERSAKKSLKRYFFGQGSGISRKLAQWGNPVFDQSWDSSDEEKEAKKARQKSGANSSRRLPPKEKKEEIPDGPHDNNQGAAPPKKGT